MAATGDNMSSKVSCYIQKWVLHNSKKTCRGLYGRRCFLPATHQGRCYEHYRLWQRLPRGKRTKAQKDVQKDLRMVRAFISRREYYAYCPVCERAIGRPGSQWDRSRQFVDVTAKRHARRNPGHNPSLKYRLA